MYGCALRLIIYFVFAFFYLYGFIDFRFITQADALSIPPERRFLGEYRDWSVVEVGGGNRCEVSNSAANLEEGTRHHNPAVTVKINFRRYDAERRFEESDEVIVLTGGHLHTEGRFASIATIDIDGEQFLLASDGSLKRKAMVAATYFFAYRSPEEPELATGEALIKAMKAGHAMTVRGGVRRRQDRGANSVVARFHKSLPDCSRSLSALEQVI